jgi:hypothetical protein
MAPPSRHQIGTSFDHPTYLELRGLRLDTREHPRPASGFPGRNVGSGRHFDDEIEGILAPGTLLPKSFGEFGELLGPGQIDREQPVPSSRASDRAPIGPVRRDPDGNPRALYREGAERAVPESAEPLQALIQQARALAWIDRLSVRPEIVGVAEPDAQVGNGAVGGRIRDPIPQEQAVPTSELSNPGELGQRRGSANSSNGAKYSPRFMARRLGAPRRSSTTWRAPTRRTIPRRTARALDPGP